MDVITEIFNSLEESKRQRILNAALKEFAENGYEQASTNRIVKNAGIGKGMLFYYFNNKKELYQYLIDYSMDVTVNEFLNLIDTTESDFIDRMKQVSELKMNLISDNPDIMNFMGTLILTQELELPEDLITRMGELKKLGNAKLYDNIDTSLFRDDVDVNKIYQLIKWSIEGYQNELTNRLKGQTMSSIDMGPLWDEYYEYLEIMKKSFYKS